MSIQIELNNIRNIEPGAVPNYSIREAAHHLRLPVATVRSWTVGRRYPTKSGTTEFPPVVTIADRDNRLLSFRNLIELHVLSAIRRDHKVKLQAVRRAINYLEVRFRSEHPLLDKKMLTDGKDLFIEQYGQIVSISQNGQMAMKKVLGIYLTRIEWDDRGIPIRLFPFTRGNYEESPRAVSIDPKVSFGDPCISGSGIPTAIIAARHEAGDSISTLAEDYGRTLQEIEEAIRYESRIAS